MLYNASLGHGVLNHGWETDRPSGKAMVHRPCGDTDRHRPTLRESPTRGGLSATNQFPQIHPSASNSSPNSLPNSSKPMPCRVCTNACNAHHLFNIVQLLMYNHQQVMYRKACGIPRFLLRRVFPYTTMAGSSASFFTTAYQAYPRTKQRPIPAWPATPRSTRK